MQVVFRADASITMGTGHVMRCLTLADVLRERGASCRFVCRAHPGHQGHAVRERGYPLELLPSANDSIPTSNANLPQHASWLGASWKIDARQTLDAIGPEGADWLVVDHYALDERWERAIKPKARSLMVIDDLADRRHECDVLLDQNLGRDRTDYAPLVPSRCLLMIGPQYALLRPSFAELRQRSLERRSAPLLRRLLIAMGGMDADNVTGAVLDVLADFALPRDSRITVVMGAQAPSLDSVRAQASRMRRPTEVLIGVRAMASLMCASDLAVGATGGSAWERCCVGLPTVAIAVATNQHSAATALERTGAALRCELGDDFRAEFHRVMGIARQPEVLRRLALASSAITDGRGAARVADMLCGGRAE